MNLLLMDLTLMTLKLHKAKMIQLHQSSSAAYSHSSIISTIH